MQRNKPFKWAMGDVNYLDYGGTWFRHLSGKRIGETKLFHFIVLINWEDACGRDAPKTKYNVALYEVNLDQLSPESKADALRSCGTEAEKDPRWIALACMEYGLRAPLLDLNGNNFSQMYAQCAAESTLMETDAAHRYQQMHRPVNAIGSTAAEFMRGDIFSAVERGVNAGDWKATIIAKMYSAAARKEGDDA
jgi:hypothetical protein